MRDDGAHRQQLLFNIRRSIRYHNARRQHYERLHLLTSALCVTFGTGTTFALLFGVDRSWAAAAAAVVTVAAVLDLVVGATVKVRMHHDLSRRFIALEKLIIQKIHANALDLRHWEAERLTIQADEPPLMKVLETMAHNDLLQAYGADASYLIPIRWYQRWLAPFADVHTHLLADRRHQDAEILAAVEPEDEPVEV